MKVEQACSLRLEHLLRQCGVELTLMTETLRVVEAAQSELAQRSGDGWGVPSDLQRIDEVMQGLVQLRTVLSRLADRTVETDIVVTEQILSDLDLKAMTDRLGGGGTSGSKALHSEGQVELF